MNDEIKTVHSRTKRINKKVLLVCGALVVLLAAGAAYFTVTMLNQNASKNAKKAASKPKLVAPAKVISSLKSANDSAKAAYDQHMSTKAAFNEQPVKLVK